MFDPYHEKRIKHGSKYTFTFLLDSMGTAINKMLDSQTGKTYIVHRYKTNTTMQGPQITVPLQDLQISWIQSARKFSVQKFIQSYLSDDKTHVPCWHWQSYLGLNHIFTQMEHPDTESINTKVT